MNFSKKISELKKENQYRKIKVIQSTNGPHIIYNDKLLINFGSNNYMGMAQDSKVKQAFIKTAKKWGVGAGASRLVTGTLKIHRDLELELAKFSKKQDVMLFPSGYMANIGLVSTLASKNDLVILDKIDHASIIDGARLSSANVRVFPHLNLKYLENILKNSSRYNQKIIIVDSIFSMDGDASDLKQLVALKKKYNAILIVDEAHAVGVFGSGGCGLADEIGVMADVDFKVGTLSKSFGLQGGYIASSSKAIDYLRNKCRSYIYTTGLNPAICGAAIQVIDIFKKFNKVRDKLKNRSMWFKAQIDLLGIDTCNTVSQIIPMVIGSDQRVMKLESNLMQAGFFVPAIRYPTVKKGTERLRISLVKQHSKKELLRFLETLKVNL